MNRRAFFRYSLIALAVIVGLVVVAVAAVYLWPLRDTTLRDVPYTKLSRVEAMEKMAALQRADQADSSLKPECRTRFSPQTNETAKVVLLFHGYTACPSQMAGLADKLFADGYTVLVPRFVEHGYRDNRRVVPPAEQLIAQANEYAMVAGGLSDPANPEINVIGISGGGVIATWLAYWRTEVPVRLLVLSPFYVPNVAQAPKYLLKPLVTLYGGSLPLADVNNGDYGTYKGLAQYQKIVANYPRAAAAARHVALAYSASDSAIDVQAARRRVAQMSPESVAYQIPPRWKLDHDIVSPDVLGDNADEAYGVYIDLLQTDAVKTP